MAKITEQSKLPPGSMPWARQVTSGVNELDTTVSRFLQAQGNTNRTTATNTQTLSSQTSLLQEQTALLQQQTAALQAQQAYQASLVTVSTSGSDFLINNIPGDQTNRWYNGAGDTAVTVNVPTGRLLVGWGVGSVELRAGNSSMYAMVRIMLTAPSGWTMNLGAATRAFVTGGTIIGVPFASERTFDGVPTDEPITIRVQFGTWSAGTSTLAAASYLTPFIRAQVIPAA